MKLLLFESGRYLEALAPGHLAPVSCTSIELDHFTSHQIQHKTAGLKPRQKLCKAANA